MIKCHTIGLSVGLVSEKQQQQQESTSSSDSDDAEITGYEFRIHSLLNNEKCLERYGKEGEDEELIQEVLFDREKLNIGWQNKSFQISAGMKNVGNSCYMNATLQAIFCLPAIVNWLISDSIHRDVCKSKSKYQFLIVNNPKKIVEIKFNFFDLLSFNSRCTKWLHYLLCIPDVYGIETFYGAICTTSRI